MPPVFVLGEMQPDRPDNGSCLDHRQLIRTESECVSNEGSSVSVPIRPRKGREPMLYLRVLADLEYARSVARVPRTQDDAIAA